MLTTRGYPCALGVWFIGLSLASAITGCGAPLNDRTVLKPLFASECDSDAQAAFDSVDVVILDWTGGRNPIYPDDVLEGVDLSLFDTADGGTLGDDEEAFKEAVRREVARIYCDLGTMPVRVRNGEDDDVDYDVTVVHITQEIRPGGGTDIGEGEYDPCNAQHDNAAILFGERLLTLSNAYAYEEWVNIFANTCAHEIGHTLGFGHISRRDRPDTGRTLYIELMLAGHTMAELRYPQRFLAGETNCPDKSGADGKHVDAAEVTCGTSTDLGPDD